MMRLVPVPWSRRVWALPFPTMLCWPAEMHGQRRHKTPVDGVQQMQKQVRRLLPGCSLVLVVDSGFAAVLLAVAYVTIQMVMVSHVRREAALYHRPEPQLSGKCGLIPLKGKRQA
jgi:hypothetical protein